MEATAAAAPVCTRVEATVARVELTAATRLGTVIGIVIVAVVESVAVGAESIAVGVPLTVPVNAPLLTVEGVEIEAEPEPEAEAVFATAAASASTALSDLTALTESTLLASTAGTVVAVAAVVAVADGSGETANVSDPAIPIEFEPEAETGAGTELTFSVSTVGSSVDGVIRLERDVLMDPFLVKGTPSPSSTPAALPLTVSGPSPVDAEATALFRIKPKPLVTVEAKPPTELRPAAAVTVVAIVAAGSKVLANEIAAGGVTVAVAVAVVAGCSGESAEVITIFLSRLRTSMSEDAFAVVSADTEAVFEVAADCCSLGFAAAVDRGAEAESEAEDVSESEAEVSEPEAEEVSGVA